MKVYQANILCTLYSGKQDKMSDFINDIPIVFDEASKEKILATKAFHKLEKELSEMHGKGIDPFHAKALCESLPIFTDSLDEIQEFGIKKITGIEFEEIEFDSLNYCALIDLSHCKFLVESNEILLDEIESDELDSLIEQIKNDVSDKELETIDE